MAAAERRLGRAGFPRSQRAASLEKTAAALNQTGGRCIHVPAHPDTDIPAKLHLKTDPAIVRYDLVWTVV